MYRHTAVCLYNQIKMKILKIDFENIHSLKGYNSIDFTAPPLSETGIFAIVGPTGSGKSTLLDVIMLALYGEMPRFDHKITEKTVEKFGTVLTRGTEKAFAQVEYLSNGKTYRSKWYIEKKRKNYSYSMELAELPSEKIIEEKKSEIPRRNEEIIGLNYEQFLKSIVLAQGNFAKFLKANPEERTEMLEKITGTQIYRTIGRRAFEIAREYKNKLAEKQNLIANFQTLTDEERSDIEQKKAEAEQKSLSFNEKLKFINEKINLKNSILNTENQLVTTNKQLAEINKQIIDFKPTANKLLLHEKIYKYKTEIFEIADLNKKLAELKTKINRNKEKENQIKTSLSSENKTLTQKQIDFKNISDKLENAKPYIEEAKKLLKEIDLQKQNFEHKNSVYLKLKTDLEKLKIENSRNEGQRKNLLINKQNTEKWLNENHITENLKTDYILISQLFSNYETTKQNTLSAVKKSSLNSIFSNKKLPQFSDIISEKISNLKQEISQININSDKKNIDDLKNQHDKILSDIKKSEKLIELSENFIKNNLKIEKSTTEKNNLDKKLTDTENLHRKTANEVEIINKKIEELEKKHEREQLEAKYKDDRLKLDDKAECPLCGSKEHPYIKQKHSVNIDITKQNLKHQKELKKKVEIEIKDLIAQISSLKTSSKNTENQLLELKNNSDSLNKNYNQISADLDVKLTISELEKTKYYYKKISDTKNKLQTEISNIEKLNNYKNQLAEAENLNEKISQIFIINNQTKEKLKPYEHLYSGAKTPKDILTSLKNQLEKYDKNTEYLTNIDSQVNALDALLKSANEKITEIDNNISTAEKELNNAKTTLKNSENKLDTIKSDFLDNLLPDNFEKTNNQTKENIGNQIFNLKNKIAILKTKQEELQKNILELENSHKSISNKKEEKNKILLEKLQKIDIFSIEEATNNLLPDQTADEIRELSEILNKKQISVNQSITDLKLKLEELQKNNDEKSLAEYETELNSISTELKNIERLFGSLKNQLENDDNQRKQKATLSKSFEQLEKDALRWEKLNSLIGDAKGKRFAEIAQQFTLTELIILANKHLKKFSNRYILDKTGDTANNLFIYDKFMGMAKRSVHTLSGGETFLVSMSLALSLSDLASRNTKIESLFIDEGFGSLDENTLDKTLINLERLHSNYNRTIGIISHVPTLKERINTKIVLSKNSSGYSSISIEN